MISGVFETSILPVTLVPFGTKYLEESVESGLTEVKISLIER